MCFFQDRMEPQTCHHEAFRILDDEMPHKDAEVDEGEGGTGIHKVNTENTNDSFLIMITIQHTVYVYSSSSVRAYFCIMPEKRKDRTISVKILYNSACFFPRGRIHGRIGDKSLKSFPPCYSQSPLLMDFTPPTPPPEPKWFDTFL
jgi:hypothetical protein